MIKKEWEIVQKNIHNIKLFENFIDDEDYKISRIKKQYNKLWIDYNIVLSELDIAILYSKDETREILIKLKERWIE